MTDTLKVLDASFYMGGNKVTSLSNGTVTSNINIANFNSSESYTALVIMAVYNGNRLISVDSKTIGQSAPGGSTYASENVNLSVTVNDADHQYVTVCVWNNDTLEPLMGIEALRKTN